MGKSFIADRLAVHARLFNDREDFLLGRFWLLNPGNLRFKHGETLAELKVPYYLGQDDEIFISGAIFSLAQLVKKRFEEESRESSVPFPSEVTVNIAHELKQKTYKVDMLKEGSIERDVATAALGSVSQLDGAILTNWLGPDGYGKSLIQWFIHYMDKALKDEANLDTPERSSYLALLAAINTITKHRQALRNVRIKGLSYERIDSIIGFTIYSCCYVALTRHLRKVKSEGATYYNEASWHILKSALTPASFISIKDNLLFNSYNPYGISSSVYEAANKHITALDKVGGGADVLVSKFKAAVLKDKNLQEMIKEQYHFTVVRWSILKYLAEYDSTGIQVHEKLQEFCVDERQLKTLLADNKQKEAFIDSLKAVRNNYSRDAQRVDSMSKLIARFDEASAGKTSWRGGDKKGFEMAVDLIVGSSIVHKIDSHVEKYTSAMCEHMIDRSVEYQPDALQQEYKNGRLYRFSYDSLDPLSTLEQGEEGQLFIDMKDFTKKTLKVKEIAMAEFMKDNFYMPIIIAASKYGAGSDLYEQEGGVRLNNLPGDAAIFSGSALNLFSLAGDIQQVLRQYSDKLGKKLPRVNEEYVLHEINVKYEKLRSELAGKKTVLQERTSRGDKAAEDELYKVIAEEHKVEGRYRDELENAIKSEMAAGLFITFGTKAEIMLMDGKGFCGTVTVAIGEKINEAARGTDRNSLVRAKLEMLLDKERVRTGNKKLKYPFDLYIDKIYRFRVPSEVDGGINTLEKRAGEVDKRGLATQVANEFFAELKRLGTGVPTSALKSLESSVDIYNKGQAISEEALRAYIKETKGVKLFFTRRIKTSELDPAFAKVFFLPMSVLELQFAYESKDGLTTVDCFVKSGEVVFKGFEAKKPTVVYEIVDKSGQFYRMITEKYFNSWLTDAKNKKDSERLLS